MALTIASLRAEIDKPPTEEPSELVLSLGRTSELVLQWPFVAGDIRRMDTWMGELLYDFCNAQRQKSQAHLRNHPKMVGCLGERQQWFVASDNWDQSVLALWTKTKGGSIMMYTKCSFVLRVRPRTGFHGHQSQEGLAKVTSSANKPQMSTQIHNWDVVDKAIEAVGKTSS
jgi:hypothetical protein